MVHLADSGPTQAPQNLAYASVAMSSVLVLGGPDGGGMAKVLRNARVEVLEAERGVDALELARDRRPDLLIVAGA